MYVDRHPLALGEQVGNLDGPDGDFLFHGNFPLQVSGPIALFRQNGNKLNFKLSDAAQR
jgi:hypothetical protein